MTHDTLTMQTVYRLSSPEYTDPELADESFTHAVKNNLRALYQRTVEAKKQAEKDLETANKSGAHIGKLIRRKRAAEKLLKEIEKHGKRDVYLTPEDKEVMFRFYGQEDFIKHFSFYVTQYE